MSKLERMDRVYSICNIVQPSADTTERVSPRPKNQNSDNAACFVINKVLSILAGISFSIII
jgi:hypothetical protein